MATVPSTVWTTTVSSLPAGNVLVLTTSGGAELVLIRVFKALLGGRLFEVGDELPNGGALLASLFAGPV